MPWVIPDPIAWGVDLRYLQWTVVAVSVLFPVAFFALPKGGSTGFYLLLLGGLTAVACRIRPMGKSFSHYAREYWPLHVAMCGLLVAMLVNQAMLGQAAFRAYDMPAQLACFALLSWVLLLAPGSHLKYLQWGLATGALFCGIGLYVLTKGGVERPLHVFGMPLIPFVLMGLLVGLFAVFSIGWNDASEKIAVALKVASGAVMLYGAYLSQTRGSWVVLPVFIAIGFGIPGKLRPRFRLALLLLAAAFLAGAYSLGDTAQRRFAEASSDVQQYFDGKEKNTPVGIRLQLWEGAWLLFSENPVRGIGREHYPEAMQQLVQRRIVTADAAAHPHSHNDLLFHMATLGIFGLAAVLALYFVPALYFLRDLRHADRQARTTAAMGLALTLGFFVFGLTDTMFYWRVSYTFYVVFLAILFASLLRRKADLACGE